MRTRAAIAKSAAIECFHNAFDPNKLEEIITNALTEALNNQRNNLAELNEGVRKAIKAFEQKNPNPNNKPKQETNRQCKHN